MEEKYITLNRKSWNDRIEAHAASRFYDLEGFRKGRSSLNSLELNLLGDIRGKSILHLQCHFGQDSISLSRLGADVTGVDFSDQAIQFAQQLAADCGTSAAFVCADVYDLPNHLTEKFDIVFTSYGTIGWLPDLKKWAGVIDHFLKPKGQFLLVEFHPFVWMFDSRFEKIAFDYFNTAPIVELESGTYADRQAPIENQTISWNHPISDVLSSLIGAGLTINALQEFDYSPYDCFENTVEFMPNQFRIKSFEKLVPMVYAVVVSKNI